MIGGRMFIEGECLEVKDNVIEKKLFFVKVLLWGVVCGSFWCFGWVVDSF